ncbi:MAG: POTRA domain-containing protein [Bryobacteraceae bacterium]|jgi:outer membrane protein assembly factor BamA
MVRPILVLLLALWAGGAAEAQKRPKAAPTPSAWPIEAIQIEGLRDYTRGQVLAVLNLKIGQMAAAKDFQAARERLFETGAFTTAGFRYGPAPGGKGYIVTFEISEVEPKFAIAFEDLGVPSDELRAALAHSDPFFGPRIPATEPLLARYSKVIQQVLTAKNSTVTVAGRLAPGDTGELQVLFEPASRPRVARVHFTGNSVVPSAALENAMNAVAVGMPYREARFRQVLDVQVRRLYDVRGRVRVAFPEIQAEPEKDVKGLVLAVKVDEGATYTLGSYRMLGASLPRADLDKVAGFKTGAVFNQDAVDAVVAKIEQRQKREGRLHVQSQVERRIDDPAKRVDLIIHVTPGPQYTFGQLTIEGLDILTEPAIRKMWAIQPGEPFNAEYPQHFLDSVREDGVLDNLGETRALVKADDQKWTVDVTLTFKGAPPQAREAPPRARRPWRGAVGHACNGSRDPPTGRRPRQRPEHARRGSAHLDV